MKKAILLGLCITSFIYNYAQSVNVTATSGTLAGSYLTLKAAFDNINNGTHKGTISISIVANTTEATSAVLNASGAGAASYTTISIQPSGGAARTISGSLAAPLIDLNGADNVTINGLNTGGNSLDISNTSTSNLTNTSTIRFILGATNNTVTNCIIEGSETNLAYGTIFFSTATGSGNDGNIISNNTITSAGANLPFNGIYSAGSSVAIDNSGISILNNNIQDYFNPAGASNGVFVASNSSAWTISGNKFFQSATRTSTAAATVRAINIVTASGTGYTVSNNIIGFANASGTGITTYNGAFANLYRGIEMTVGTSVVSNVQGNQISSIIFSTTSASALPGIFSGISILGGSINIGTTSGNTIGTTSGNGSITITSTTTAGVITGIYSGSVNTVDIENNNIGAISTTGAVGIGYVFNGIYTAGALGNYTIASNIIGSSATINSISMGDLSTTTGVCTLNGINNAATGTISINSNTIQNATAYGTGASLINGILNSAGSGTLNITNNNVITVSNTGTSTINGISNTAATASTANINSNTIRSSALSGTGAFTAILNTSAVATTNINSNIIRNISRSAVTGPITGISSTGAITTALNINSNQLGNSTGDFATFDVANSSPLIGINVTTATGTAALTIQNNDIRGIVHTIAGSGPHTYIINTAATLSQSILNNTFTNLNVNTTGSVTFISNSVILPANGVQNVTGNSIVTGFNKVIAGGTVTLFTSVALTVASGVTVNHTNNDFSNITVTGATILAGWVHTDAGISVKTFTGNTFNNWTGGTSAITGLTVSGFGGASTVSNNTINNVTGQAAITGITIGGTGSATTLSITGNTITNLVSSGTGGTVTALASANLSTSVTIDANIINTLSSTGTTATITGINVTAGVNVNITNHNIYGLSASGITTPIINGISAASTGTVSIQTNSVYGISTSGIATSGYTFNGIIASGAAGNFNISANTIGSTTIANTISIGTNGVTTTGVCIFNGIINSSTGSTAITNNTIQNCSVFGTGASVFNGIINSGSTGTLYITGNGIRFGTNTGTGNFFGITNSASPTVATIYINSNIIRGHTRTAASGAFTGISNTGAATSSININTNQIGNINGGALTFTNASSGTITGISNNAGTATTTVNINGNSMDGFSVVSSGAFTGIINAGAATGIAININSNQIGTTTGNVITYSAANSTALVGISNTGGASTCALSIQSNDISGIVHSVGGTSAHTYVINSAATLSQNISTNTFTNLNVNTTGSIIFISNNVIVSATGTQNVDGNSIVGTFTRTSSSASGALTLFTSSANSVAGGVITNNNNNFSNITVSGAATIAGWMNTDAGAGTKTIQGNTFSNWTGGTGLVTGINVNIAGAGNAITGNNINNFTSGGNINVITTGAGNDNIYSNTISSISSTGTGLTIVNGINVTGGTTKNIYQNTITGLHANFSNLSGNIQNSLAVDGILVSGGTTVNVSQNIISGFTADAIDAGTVNGITVSGGTTVTLFRNKIYDLSSNSTAINAGGISGLFVFSVAGSVTNIINNTIGDIRTPVSGNSDSYRGISINTNTVSDINVYFNTIYLNSTSTGANFGSTGIYHAFNANNLIGKLDLRNNIITNLSVPTGTGITALFRQYGAALNNYAPTSNNNLYYAGTPGPKRVIFLIDPSSSDQTLPAFKARLVNREGQSFTEDVTVNFLSLVGSSPYFLHIDPTICTRLESGGVNISGITDDYDGQVRQGNPGYTGTGTAPDIGADEFEGSAIPTANLSGTTTICNGSSAILTLTVTGTGTITGTLSDGTPFSGTAPIITVNVSPAVTTTYTIATLTNGTCTSISADMTGSAIVTVNARPTGVLSGTTSICNGNLATLSIAATGTGTISGTLSDGTVFSGTAPTITINISPSTTTIYTIATMTNGTCVSIAGDKTGSATVTVNGLPATPTISAGGPLTFCAGGSVTLTSSAGTTYLWSTGVTTSSISPTTSGSYTVQVTNAAGCQSASSAATTVTVNARPTGALSGTTSICNGNSATLSIAATGTGTITGTLSDGTVFSGTAPTITVSVGTSSTTTYTIATMTNGTCASIGADKTGSAILTVTTPPSATISYATPFCANTGTAAVTFSGTAGGSYSSSPAGVSINSGTGLINLALSSPGQYTITYTVGAAGGCSIYTTNTVVVINPFTWTGGISTDWNTAGNWAGNTVPTTACSDVTILSGVPYQPTLSSGIATIQNIFINSGATLTISNATLQLSGTINNSGTFDVSNGAIEMNGSGSQTIPASAFQSNTLKDLIISNSSSGGVSLGGALDVYGSLTYTGTGMKLVTNDFLALKSNATNTAWIGDMTGNTITGKVSVERYISAHRAWRFLSVPTNTTQTIKQSWQENQAANNTSLVGWGTQISSNRSTWAADGFDFYSVGGPSMKVYNSSTGAWDGITGTGIGIKTMDGYMAFIRGDRSANGAASTPTQTVMRTKGDLFTGDQSPIIIPAGKFSAIGNPYASALDMRYITKAGVKNFFYLWDPNIGGLYGLGGYQTFSYNGSDYEVTPGGGSYPVGGSVSNYIQSGLAFFVQATGTGGSVTLKEGAKTSGSALVSAPVRNVGLMTGATGSTTFAQKAQMRTNMYGVNADNSTYIVDGVLINYGNDYSNNVDDLDAIKSVNVGENLSLKTDNQLLVIERRHSITQQDTIFLNLGHVKVQKYRFEFTASFNQPGLTGYLEDSYLNTKTLLNMNGTTTADFSIVNIPGAYAANRFRIVFTQASVLPLTLTSVKAYQANKNIAVEWKTANESNMKQYEVEKSVDANHYTKANTVGAHNAPTNNYSWIDAQPVPGYNYYRIKSIDINGEIKYSPVVKVFMGKTTQEITVYPNPVTNNTINLQLVNQPAGNYKVKLLNNMGQQVLEKDIEHAEGSSTELIPVNQIISKGIYQLQVIKPDNSTITNKLIF